MEADPDDIQHLTERDVGLHHEEQADNAQEVQQDQDVTPVLTGVAVAEMAASTV